MRKSIISVLGPTDPVYDLTTVEAVNAALGITGNTADDATTAAQITAASRIIADLCNRTFALLDVTESFRVQWGEPVHVLYLRQYPVTQVVSITQADSEADPALYELDDEAGLLWMKCGRFCGEVIATYSGGYDLPTEAPPLLAQACIEVLRAQHFNVGRDPNIRTVQHIDTSVTFSDYYQRFGLSGSGATSVLPPNAAGMIEKYIERRV